jgi:hypothetical protein
MVPAYKQGHNNYKAIATQHEHDADAPHDDER